jgi:hypothetical protein
MGRSQSHQHFQNVVVLVKQGPKGLLNQAILKLTEFVNQDGLHKQLGFLKRHLGYKKTTDLSLRELKKEDEITTLIAAANNSERNGILIRVVYDLKMKEAHELAHSRPRQLFRYLVNKLGVARIRDLIDAQ